LTLKGRNTSTYWLIGAALAVVILVGMSMAVALIAKGGEAELKPESTPEGIVQRYLVALDSDHPEDAYNYLSQRLKDACSYQYFRDSTTWLKEQDMRISLAGTQTANDAQEVTVRIRQIYIGRGIPFTPDESSYTQRFLLKQTDSKWMFSEPPWPMSYCPGLEPTRFPVPKPAIP